MGKEIIDLKPEPSDEGEIRYTREKPWLKKLKRFLGGVDRSLSGIIRILLTVSIAVVVTIIFFRFLLPVIVFLLIFSLISSLLKNLFRR